VRQYNTTARKLWYTLKEAHQDHSSGGMMYWLRKLTISRMTGDDILTHLEEMGKIYEQLNSLVSPENPLTTDNIFSVSILTSLPQDWLACVSSMMNDKKVNPSRIINALKQEDLRRKVRSEDLSVPKSASKTSAPPGNKPRTGASRYFCSFCKIDGYSLERCQEAAKILAEATSKPSQESSNRQGSRRGRRGQQKGPARAGQTTVVKLGGGRSR
jgi:hypothetical protein